MGARPRASIPLGDVSSSRYLVVFCAAVPARGVGCSLVSVVVRLDGLSLTRTTRDDGTPGPFRTVGYSLPAPHGALIGIGGRAWGHGCTPKADNPGPRGRHRDAGTDP